MRKQLLWSFHNLIAHPVSELCHWLGYLVPPVRRFGNWLHDGEGSGTSTFRGSRIALCP